MADNYLEKKMEDYRRGVTMASRRSAVPSAQPTALAVIPPQRVALIIENGELLSALVATLREYGMRVAFAESDRRQGTQLAQLRGALFVPVTDVASEDSAKFLLAAAEKRWGGVDAVVIDCCRRPSVLHEDTLIIHITDADNGGIDEDAPGKVRRVIATEKAGEEWLKSLSRATLMMLSPLADAIASVTVITAK